MNQNKDEQLIRVYKYGVEFDLMLSKRKPTHVYLIGNYAGRTKEFHPPYVDEKVFKELAEQIKGENNA